MTLFADDLSLYLELNYFTDLNIRLKWAELKVLQCLALSHLHNCLVICYSAAKNGLQKVQIVQNRAADLVLNCPFRQQVEEMHAGLFWLMVEERLLLSLFYLTSEKCVC